MGEEKIVKSVYFRWAAIFCLVALGLISLGVLYYHYETQVITEDKYEDLSAIAKLKTASIQEWRRNRLADVRRLSASSLVSREIARLLQDPRNPKALAELQRELKINRRAKVSVEALFLDTNGRILLSDSPGPIIVDQATLKAIEIALKDRKEGLSDFFRTTEGSIYIDALAPVLDNSGRPIAIVVMRSQAADYLYPLIQTWPTPSRTAETLLVGRDGDSVVFLNELRHKSHSALSLKYSLAETRLPAVQAVLGHYGRFRGRDYRGVEVLAVTQPVPESPWSIVAKVDTEELLTEIRYRAGVVGLIVFLLILISAGLIISVYRKRSREALKASETRYRRLFETAQDGILIIDADSGQISDVNPFLIQMLGYSYEDFMGRKLWEIGAFKDIEASQKAFLELQSREYVRYEDLPLQTKDGRFINVEFVSNVYRVDHKKVIQCNIRDITERKQIEDAQRFLLQCGLPASGEDFFKSLARYLAKKLGMDYVCIDRLQEEGLAAQTVAIYFDGRFEDNLKYTLKDTPCGDVVGKTFCCFPAGVRQLYPEDLVLQEMMAESYVGTILLSSQGQPIGLIAIIGRRPLDNPQLAESILKVVAIRAAGELERKETEEALQQRSLELQQLSAGLETQVQERTEKLAKANQDLRQLSEILISAQEKERKRIALEVHDVLGSALTAIKFKIEEILARLSDDKTLNITKSLEPLIPIIMDSIQDVRRIQFDLRPPHLDDLGIVATLSWFSRRFQTIYSGIEVKQAVSITEEEVPDHLKIVLFRIVQEAMNNIGKHAQADSVYLGLQRVDKALELSIRDNGKGFDLQGLSSGGNSKRTLGLSSMKERTEFSGGSFFIDYVQGKGTVIRALWPL